MKGEDLAIVVTHSNLVPTSGRVVRLQSLAAACDIVVADSETAAVAAAPRAEITPGSTGRTNRLFGRSSPSRQPVMALHRTLEQAQGIHVWDPFPSLCPGATCSGFDGDKPLFHDGDHLRGHGNPMLVEAFTREFVAFRGLEDGRNRGLSSMDVPGAFRGPR